MISHSFLENGRTLLPKIQQSHQQYNNQLLVPVKSQDFCLGRFASQLTDVQKQRSSPLNNSILTTTILVEPRQKKGVKGGLRMLKKMKRLKKKNPFDYRKNICGYITKKVIRQFTSSDYQHEVEELCRNYGCDYNQAKLYYAGKIQHVTGPSHIPGLLVPEDLEEQKIKSVFREFFQWFLREHYLRYILMEGKMSDKKAYIDYKNNILLSMLDPEYINHNLKLKMQSQKEKLRNSERSSKKVQIVSSQQARVPKSQYFEEFPHIIHIPIAKFQHVVIKKQPESC